MGAGETVDVTEAGDVGDGLVTVRNVVAGVVVDVVVAIELVVVAGFSRGAVVATPASRRGETDGEVVVNVKTRTSSNRGLDHITSFALVTEN